MSDSFEEYLAKEKEKTVKVRDKVNYTKVLEKHPISDILDAEDLLALPEFERRVIDKARDRRSVRAAKRKARET